MRPVSRAKTFPLTDKVVVITGGGRGLGEATATAAARRGAHVAVLDRDLASAEATVATLPKGRALAVSCDVTDLESVRAGAEQVRSHFRRIDTVIANAGVMGRGGTPRSSPAANADLVFSVNVQGVLNTVAATIEDVVANRGHLVFVSSVFAFLNGAGAIPYAMSKAAVEQLARGLSTELAAHHAGVTTAYFSLIETPMIAEGLDADPHLTQMMSASPSFMLKRIKPEQAATAIVDGIEARQARVMIPGRWRPFSALRGVLAPVMDRASLTDATIQGALAKLEEAASAPSHPVDPLRSA